MEKGKEEEEREEASLALTHAGKKERTTQKQGHLDWSGRPEQKKRERSKGEKARHRREEKEIQIERERVVCAGKKWSIERAADRRRGQKKRDSVGRSVGAEQSHPASLPFAATTTTEAADKKGIL